MALDFPREAYGAQLFCAGRTFRIIQQHREMNDIREHADRREGDQRGQKGEKRQATAQGSKRRGKQTPHRLGRSSWARRACIRCNA